MKSFITSALLAVFIVIDLPGSARADLIGWWRLDGDAIDQVGGHNGSIHGANFSWTNTDKIAGAGAFRVNPGNQANTFIEIADNPLFQFGTNDFSVCYWAKKMHASGNYSDTYGVDKWNSGASSGNEWTLNLSTGSSPAGDDRPTFAIATVANGIYGVSNPTNSSLGVWHFIAGVRRQAAIELYVDGVFAGSAGIPATAAVNNVAGGRDLYIGLSAQGPGFGANAFYDEVRIYNHALSNGGASVGTVAGGEIASLYNTLPVIISHPLSQAVFLGSNASFTVATTFPPTSYQWRLNATNLLADATNATLPIPDVAPADLGNYDVLITNDVGGAIVSSAAELYLPRLSAKLLPGKIATLSAQAPSGAKARIDTSSDLVNWVNLTNFTASTNPFPFTNVTSASAAGNRFYRAAFSP